MEILSPSKKLVNFSYLEFSGMKWQKCYCVVTDIASTKSESPITWSLSLFWASDRYLTYSFVRISSLDSSRNKWNGKYWIYCRKITTLTELSRITSCTKKAHISYWLQLLMLPSKEIIKVESSSSNASFDSTNRPKHISLAVFFFIGFCHTYFTLAEIFCSSSFLLACSKYFSILMCFIILILFSIYSIICFRHFNIMEPKELPSPAVSVYLRRSWHNFHKFRIE